MDHYAAFIQLSAILTICAAVSLVMHLFRQPLIIGYIITGIVLAQSPLDIGHSKEVFETFSSIGIALLLFIIGLGLNVAVFRKLGKPVFVTAMAVLLTLGTTGFVIMSAFGADKTTAILIGFSLFFSSTIIIAKVLSDKKELSRLHGQLAIGVILLDDLVATIALLFVSAGDKGFDSLSIGLLLAKGILAGVILFVVSNKVLPRFSRLFATSQELLFLFAIAWGFGIATLFKLSGFSIEVGALFAGVALASLPYSQEITARLKPLRDFFVVMFFITLGASLTVQNLTSELGLALILSVAVIILKPLAVMLSLGLLGYTRRTSFKTGINLSQISEFSIILIVLAHQSGMVAGNISAIITIVALITIASSTYLMKYDDRIFAKLDRSLRLFERRVVSEEKKKLDGYPFMLFGYQNGGHEFVKTFREMKRRFVVIDYDPDVAERLERDHINILYGDATDIELLEELDMTQVKLVASTISDVQVNESLLQNLLHRNPDIIFVCHAVNYDDAARLYELGAAYVMMPHLIGTEKLSAFIRKNGTDRRRFDEYREKHMLRLGRIALS